jgi:hypothetical protein
LSAHWETFGAEPFKFGETLIAINKMVIPSQVPMYIGKGVETRWRAPKLNLMIEQGEGIVQTTNPPVGGAVKTVEGKKILWAAMPVTVQLRSGAH